MAAIRKDQLYPFMHALSRHHKNQAHIAELGELPEELQKTLERLDHTRFEEAPAPEHALSPELIRAVVKACHSDEDTQLLVYEDGPGARRQAGEADKKAMEEAEEAYIQSQKRLFFISLGYALPCMIGARVSFAKYYELTRPKKVDGPKIEAIHTQKLQIHPLQILGFVLILIAAWGIATAWNIANEIWIDWTRAKSAVPVVGKAWAEKGVRDKEERERERRRQLGGA